MNISELQTSVHRVAVQKGWWDEPQNTGTLIALCHSELSEALEEARLNRYETYYVDRKPEGFGVELADCVIRILDMCEYYNIDLESLLLEKHEYNKTRSYKHGGKEF